MSDPIMDQVTGIHVHVHSVHDHHVHGWLCGLGGKEKDGAEVEVKCKVGALWVRQA